MVLEQKEERKKEYFDSGTDGCLRMEIVSGWNVGPFRQSLVFTYVPT